MTDSSKSRFVNEHLAGVKNRLRHLQENTRFDLRALMVDRAAQVFSLQNEPVPNQAAYRVQVMVHPQDPFVGEEEIRHMNADDIRPGLRNDRVVIMDSVGAAAQPDEQGHYLYPPGSTEFDQVNAFYYTTMTLRMYERYAQRALPWAFTNPRLSVDPHAGNDANAFYNEQEQRLGFQLFSPTEGAEPVSTAQSADIVSHEAGHAVLDGLRDLYNESFGLGTAAFHESFGDMTAVLVALHDDSLLRRLLSLTDNNLQIDNFIAAIGEQLSSALMSQLPEEYDHTVYLRNAINTLTMLPFDQLLYRPGNPLVELGRQPHNYSRLFTGAFYDALVAIYEHQREAGATPHIALSRARDIVGRLLVTAVECGPVGELNFADMAQAFIAADQLRYQGTYAALLTAVFDRRGVASRADLNTFREVLLALPEIVLPTALNTPMASLLFLEQQIIPTLNLPTEVEFEPASIYRSAEGHAFLTFITSTTLTLSGERYSTYSGADLEVFGGLSLAFSPQNRLVSAIYRPVTEEDLRQIRVMIADLIQEGLIVSANANSDVLPMEDGIPEGVVLLNTSTSQPHDTLLVRFPAIVDTLRPVSGFREYLRDLVKAQQNSQLDNEG